MDLNRTDERILKTLLGLFSGDPVSAAEIAEEIDLHAVTVRDHMRTLRALDLVESFIGPRGGYKPTATAYRELGVERDAERVDIPVYRDDARLEGVVLDTMSLLFNEDPDRVCVEAHLDGDTGGIDRDDRLVVGPVPPWDILIEGIVRGRTADDGVFLAIEEVHDLEDRPDPVESRVNVPE